MTSVLKENAYIELRKAIDQKGLKRKYVATRIGIGPSYLGQILNGSRKLSTDVAIKASQVLDLPSDIFLNKS